MSNFVLKVAFQSHPDADTEMYRMRCPQPSSVTELVQLIKHLLPAVGQVKSMETRNAEGKWIPLTSDSELTAAITGDQDNQKLVVKVSAASSTSTESSTESSIESSTESEQTFQTEKDDNNLSDVDNRYIARRRGLRRRQGCKWGKKIGYFVVALFAFWQLMFVLRMGRHVHNSPQHTELVSSSHLRALRNEHNVEMRDMRAEIQRLRRSVEIVATQQQQRTSAGDTFRQQTQQAVSELNRRDHDTNSQIHALTVSNQQLEAAVVQLQAQLRQMHSQLQSLRNQPAAEHQTIGKTSKQEEQEGLLTALGDTAKLVKQMVKDQWEDVPLDDIRELARDTFRAVKSEVTAATRKLNAALEQASTATEPKRKSKPIVENVRVEEEEEDDDDDASHKRHEKTQKRRKSRKEKPNSHHHQERMHKLQRELHEQQRQVHQANMARHHAHKRQQQPWWQRRREL